MGAVWQARVRISAWHSMEVPPTGPKAVYGEGPQRMMNDVWMYLLYKEKEMQKEWYTATKPLDIDIAHQLKSVNI